MSTTTDNNPKLPPQNLAAEGASLGAILLDNSVLSKAEETLRPTDFYRGAHRLIYAAMLDLSAKGEPIDTITLTDALTAAGEIQQVGGAAYLAELINSVASTANVEYHAKIIREKAVLRAVIAAGHTLMSRGYEAADSANEILAEAERQIFALAHGSTTQGFRPSHDVLQETLDHLKNITARGRGGVTGVPTGFRVLDRLTAGWQNGDLIIVAARPGVGKTSLALGSALHAALVHEKRVGVFSLEMPANQLMQRFLSAQAKINLHDLRHDRMTLPERWKLTEAAGRMEQAPIYIDDTGGITVQQMRGKARRLKAERGLDLLIVDYLQLMQGRSDSESRQQEISDISRSLKALAKELNVPIIALSQLNRNSLGRDGKRPELGDLRDSGSIEQDADIVLLIHRAELVDPESPDRGTAEILVRKNRNGPIGDLRLAFVDRLASFADLATEEEEEIDENSWC